ncbi:MAG: UbiA family prenyltransferase [Flavobacteriia bacterium]|jgi:4-hydroxybenzoate polyprenyltransferase
MNEFSKPEENNASFLKRFYIYQKERFPFISHGLLVASFTFSAIAYSLMCRGESEFVSWKNYAVAVFTTFTLFLLVRIFDEFKDAQDDAAYRRELPVPRGVMKLRELMWIGIIVAILQITVNALFFPKLLIIYAIIIVYLSLMGKEFFIPEWLKKHQFWYITSHMFIIPLIDIFASGMDWMYQGLAAPIGLIFFFCVSYMNGIVLEIGRKIKIEGDEKEGVLTYTKQLGSKKAIYTWILVLFLTLVLSLFAAYYANQSTESYFVLGSAFLICVTPGILFLKQESAKKAKFIEYASGLWAIVMYLALGGIPMLLKMFGVS